jgi:ribosomal protein S27AE
MDKIEFGTNNALTDETATEIGKRLYERDAKAECPRCAGPMSVVANGLVALPIFGGDDDAPPQRLNCACIRCKKCGFVALHSLDSLGLGH